MDLDYPNISCVVIGLNCERTLAACIQSIKLLNYPKLLDIIYVDGGSQDKSVAIAKTFLNINVLEFNEKKTTPGKQRNEGWKKSRGEWVQFFDSDIIAHPEWLINAARYFANDKVALFGARKELQPYKNWFHFVANLEWPEVKDDVKFFGGDVIIKRSILERVGGYDETLVAGEDPELASRIRISGSKIESINTIMCYHDINMNKLSQYLTRSCRSGYGYASAGLKMLKNGDTEWAIKVLKILVKVLAIIFLFGFTLIFKTGLSFFLALIIALFPLLKVKLFQKKFDISIKQSFIYATHCSVVIWPQSFGAVKYFTTVMLKNFKGQQ